MCTSSSFDHLQGVLSFEEIRDIPMAVLLNKKDVPGAANEEEILNYFALQNLVTGKVNTTKQETLYAVIYILWLRLYSLNGP